MTKDGSQEFNGILEKVLEKKLLHPTGGKDRFLIVTIGGVEYTAWRCNDQILNTPLETRVTGTYEVKGTYRNIMTFGVQGETTTPSGSLNLELLRIVVPLVAAWHDRNKNYSDADAELWAADVAKASKVFAALLEEDTV